jgi:hypothetical protein
VVGRHHKLRRAAMLPGGRFGAVDDEPSGSARRSPPALHGIAEEDLTEEDDGGGDEAADDLNSSGGGSGRNGGLCELVPAVTVAAVVTPALVTVVGPDNTPLPALMGVDGVPVLVSVNPHSGRLEARRDASGAVIPACGPRGNQSRLVCARVSFSYCHISSKKNCLQIECPTSPVPARTRRGALVMAVKNAAGRLVACGPLAYPAIAEEDGDGDGDGDGEGRDAAGRAGDDAEQLVAVTTGATAMALPLINVQEYAFDDDVTDRDQIFGDYAANKPRVLVAALPDGTVVPAVRTSTGKLVPASLGPDGKLVPSAAYSGTDADDRVTAAQTLATTPELRVGGTFDSVVVTITDEDDEAEVAQNEQAPEVAPNSVPAVSSDTVDPSAVTVTTAAAAAAKPEGLASSGERDMFLSDSEDDEAAMDAAIAAADGLSAAEPAMAGSTAAPATGEASIVAALQEQLRLLEAKLVDGGTKVQLLMYTVGEREKYL